MGSPLGTPGSTSSTMRGAGGITGSVRRTVRSEFSRLCRTLGLFQFIPHPSLSFDDSVRLSTSFKNMSKMGLSHRTEIQVFPSTQEFHVLYGDGLIRFDRDGTIQSVLRRSLVVIFRSICRVAPQCPELRASVLGETLHTIPEKRCPACSELGLSRIDVIHPDCHNGLDLAHQACHAARRVPKQLQNASTANVPSAQDDNTQHEQSTEGAELKGSESQRDQDDYDECPKEPVHPLSPIETGRIPLSVRQVSQYTT